MLKKSLLLPAVVALLALTWAACDTVDEPEPFEFKLQDLNGTTFELAEKTGNVVIVNFFQTTCDVCEAHVDTLKAIYETYEGDDLIIVGVSMESRETLQAFKTEHEIPYPILLDPSGDVTRYYGVQYIPTNIFYNKAGVAIGYSGPITQDQFAEVLDDLLQ